MRALHSERASRRPTRACAPAIALLTWLLLVAAFEAVRPLALDGASLCPMKTITGVPCPTCGSTRAVRAAASGDLVAAFTYNPLTMIVVAVAAAWLVMRFGAGRRVMLSVGPDVERRLWFALLAVLGVNWLYVLWRAGSLGT